MSVNECFKLTPEACRTDALCTLEFDAGNEGSVCVPKLERLRQMELSEDDLFHMRTIFGVLLPRVDAEAVEGAMKQMRAALFPRIIEKATHLMTESPHRSWQSLVRDISQTILTDIEQSPCPFCLDLLNDEVNDDVIVRPCRCQALFHSRCIQQCRDCPMCRRRLDPLKLGSVVDRRPQFVNYSVRHGGMSNDRAEIEYASHVRNNTINDAISALENDRSYGPNFFLYQGEEGPVLTERGRRWTEEARLQDEKDFMSLCVAIFAVIVCAILR